MFIATEMRPGNCRREALICIPWTVFRQGPCCAQLTRCIHLVKISGNRKDLRKAPLPSSTFPRSSPIVQGLVVHPDKLPFNVQVPKANPGAPPVGTFGQEVLGRRIGLEGWGDVPGFPRPYPTGDRGGNLPPPLQNPGPPAPLGCGC